MEGRCGTVIFFQSLKKSMKVSLLSIFLRWFVLLISNFAIVDFVISDYHLKATQVFLSFNGSRVSFLK